MILRTRLPFLCNMATITCKPTAEPVLPLVRTVPENVQSRDTFCLPALVIVGALPDRGDVHQGEVDEPNEGIGAVAGHADLP